MERHSAAYEGRRLREGLLDKTNTASSVGADTAYRSKANEELMEKNGFVSHVHRKKPKGRAMPEAISRANNVKSKIRSKVEHVFAQQKDRMDLFIRTIGIARATVKIGRYQCGGLGSPRLDPSPMRRHDDDRRSSFDHADSIVNPFQFAGGQIGIVVVTIRHWPACPLLRRYDRPRRRCKFRH